MAAQAYAAMCGVVILFQLALIAGAPWGRVTQGGAHAGALPLRNRVFAGVSAVLLAAMAAAILSAAGQPPGWPRWTGWAALAMTALVTLANWITPSRAERRVWAPITTAMLAAALLAILG